MEHILENSIITEKYINEIKKLNQIKYEKYIETRFHLTIKYLIPDSFSNKLYQKINSLPFADSYSLNIIENSYVPFIIKSNLFYELNELNNIFNQSGFVENIKEISNKLEIELGEENYNSITLNDGEIIERNIKLLEKFKEDYGYDPLNFSIINYTLNNKDDFDLDLYEKEEKETKIIQPEKEVKIDNNIKLELESNEIKKKIDDKLHLEIKEKEIKEKEIKNEENCSLKSLIQLLDLCEINFNNTLKDIIIDENIIKKEIKKEIKKVIKKETKKENKKESKKDNEIDNEIIILIKKALKLKEIDFKKEEEKEEDDKIKDQIKESIESARLIADYYLTNEKLKYSPTKANMIYLYLISKFNDPISMYQLGDALINGNSIMKNHRQGTKLIKISAEQYKYPKAITKMKMLLRFPLKSK